MNNNRDTKENNDITVIMQNSIDSLNNNSAVSSPKNIPLSNNHSLLNSIEKRGKGLPSKSRFGKSSNKLQQIQRENQSVDSLDLNTEMKQQQQQQQETSKEEYDELERRFADAVLKYEHLKSENQRLRCELQLNKDEVASLKSHLNQVEQTIVDVESEKQVIQEASMKNEAMYKKVIETLQNKVEDLSLQLSTTISPSQQHIEHRDRDNELVPKYEKLLRDYKVLQHQFEVEKSSKLVLMDQIEFLAHKNEGLVNQLESPMTDDLESDAKSIDDFVKHTTHGNINEAFGQAQMNIADHS